MKATIYISLKNGVLDPQGKAIENALGQLGFDGVDNVRQGKMIELELADTDANQARDRLQEMCEKLLANTVIENYDIRLNEAE
ncbi:MAG: phosphoribosylformylglycinamidine synthase subunit PurS [Pseudomonadota bacterium]|nr:phosphoribosylformylglycinamidine synthase subunit PurS [Pseudomonadota bacterium]